MENENFLHGAISYRRKQIVWGVLVITWAILFAVWAVFGAARA